MNGCLGEQKLGNSQISHICSKSYSSNHASNACVTSKKSLSNNDASDDNVTLDSSYSRLLQTGTDSHGSEQVSIDFLKHADKIQRQVQHQLERLQGKQRHLTTGNKTIKSDLHRAGDSAVKQEISWPHHHCFPGPAG